MRVLNFNKFILERVGVSIPSLNYSKLIFNKIKSLLIEFKSSDEISLEKSIVIGSDELEPYMTSLEQYKMFPVTGIELGVSFDRVIDGERNFSIGGSAIPFGHRNWKTYSRLSNPIKNTDHGLIIKCGGITIDVSDGFDDFDKMDDEINSTIWHELNHLYENYNRYLNIGGRVLDRTLKVSLTYSDSNRWGIKKDIFKFWDKNFLYLIYRSEPYEVNANIQELSYYVIKYGFNKVYDGDIWKHALLLRDFKSDIFIDDLSNEILKHYNDDEKLYIMNRLKKMFISEYNKILKLNKEKSTINIDKIKNMSFNEFISFFQRRFNKTGEKFVRKIGKLKSLEK